MTDKRYWMEKDAKDVVKKLQQYHGTWQIWGFNPMSEAWSRNTISYYSAVLEPTAWETSLQYAGEQGELVKMQVPQARSLTRQFVALVTKQKLAFNCVALSEGADVAQETKLGNALANQIVEQESLDRKADLLAEQAFVLGGGFLGAFWRTNRGRPYAVGEAGDLVYDGELEVRNFSMLDVFYDYSIPDWEQQNVVEVRIAMSRWDLVAQFPGLKDKIIALPSTNSGENRRSTQFRSVSDDDMVYCYEVYHKPTPAMPQGRMLMYSDEETIYFDGPNRYGCIPIEPCIPEPVFGWCLGYPKFSDLLPAQEMLDHSFSAIATNQAAFAVQNVTVPRGSGISVSQIQGMNFLHFTPQNVPGGGKPEPLNLTQSSPETFKFLETLRAHMMEISTINSALRGAPPPGVTAGAAIATLTTNAMEFLTSFSKAYLECLEKTMMHSINAYRRFASIPHLVKLVGKQGKSFNKEFVGGDLDPILSVKINQMNPVMLTAAGRSDLADKLLQTGMIKSPQEYISVLEGEPVQKIYQTELSENDLVSSENDAMMDGEEVPVLSTDDHAAHIRCHSSLLNDPAIRKNNPNIQIILAHILEHRQQAESADPFLQAMMRTGKMPEGGPPQVAGPMGPGGGLPPPGGPAGVTSGPPPQQAQSMPKSKPAQPADDLLGRA